MVEIINAMIFTLLSYYFNIMFILIVISWVPGPPGTRAASPVRLPAPGALVPGSPGAHKYDPKYENHMNII